MPAYESLAALPDATADDLTNAGVLCIAQKLAPRGRELLQLARTRFPEKIDTYLHQGWACIKAGLPDEALVAFQAAERSIKAPGQKELTDLFAGLVVSHWLTKDNTGAVAAYKLLIPSNAAYADKKWVSALDWSDAEKIPLLAALAETLRLHPELVPKASGQ